jgi:hypothetical protein
MFDVSSFDRILACKDGFLFPWKSIWRTKVPLRVAFFAWSMILERFLQWIILRSGMSLWSICVAYAKGMGSLWIIFFSIVRLPASYIMLSLVTLGCPGLCPVGWLICFLAGGHSRSVVV